MSNMPRKPENFVASVTDADGRIDNFALYATANAQRALAVGEAIGAAVAGLRRLYRTLVVARLERRRTRQAAYRELMSMDEHMLRDIGITRGDIPYVVRGGAVNENQDRKAA